MIMAITAPDLICTIHNIIGVNALFKALLNEKYTIVPGQTCVNSKMFMCSDTSQYIHPCCHPEDK
jgi:hypothetical protein